jgi:hypothetical protein
VLDGIVLPVWLIATTWWRPLHCEHPFFRDNLSSRANIVSKEFNQDPELSKSFYRMSIESFSLSVERALKY